MEKRYFKVRRGILSLLISMFWVMIISSFSMQVEAADSEGGDYPMLLDQVEGANIETFYIERPDPEALKDNIVYASDFGLDAKSEDNYKAFSNALLYCKDHPNTKLVIDKGVYYFKTDASLQMDGLKNVLIEGNNAEFIFETQKQFAISACDGVELRDLIVDWNWEKDRVASLVQVQNKSDDSFEIKFLELDDVDENIPIISFQQYSKEDFVPGEYGSWKTFNPFEVPGSITSVEKIEPNVLKVGISSRFTTSFHNEEVYILRHYTYGGAAFTVSGSSSNITFDHINLYGSAGMGFVFGEKANHFQILNSCIGLRPGYENRQRMSTSADGIHILNTGGYFRIDHCDFSYTGDDILNVHDDMLKVTEIIDPTQLKGDVTGGFAQKGDKIRIYDLNLQDIGFETEVLSCIRKGDGATLTLKDALPTQVDEGFFVYRSGCNTHNYVISNNYIHETKGRAALLNASDALFENNTLYRTLSECVEVRMDLSEITNKIWYEGIGATNVVIQNNTFEECAFGGKAAIIKIECSRSNITNNKILSDIHIANNEFDYCYGADLLIYANNVSDLYIQDNVILDCGDIKISDNCGAVYNSGNEISYPSKNCQHADTKQVGDRKAGCFEYGSTGITYCNQCHTIINSNYRGIPPLKHKGLLVKRIDVEPTCIEDGSSSMVCSLCRTVVESGIVEPASGQYTVKLEETIYTYDGKMKKPSPVFYDELGKKMDHVDYSVSYDIDCMKPGTHKAVVSLTGSYKDTKELTYTIAEASVTSLTNSWYGVTARWEAAAGYEYALYRTKTGMNKWELITTSKQSAFYDKTAVNNERYTYAVALVKDGRILNRGEEMTCHYMAPPSISSVNNLANGVSVNWNAVAGSAGYYVYRKEGQSGTWHFIGSSLSTSYTDQKDVEPGAVYYYAVKSFAKEADGSQTLSASSAAKNTVYVKNTFVSTLTNPAAGKLLVSYSKSTQATGYEIEYCPYSTFGLASTKTITVTNVNTLNQTITGLKKGTTCYVRVRAYKTMGGYTFYSPWSTAKSIKLTV